MRTLLICILLPCCIMLGITPCKSQSYVKVPYYMDMDVTISLIDSLKENDITDFIIYQTTDRDNSSCGQSGGRRTSKMVTYILWDRGSNTGAILIKDSCVLQNSLNKSTVFSFQHFTKL